MEVQDPPYRKKVYDLLSSNFSDFKRTEQEFNAQLDSDPEYAGRVYGVLSSSFSDFKRPKEEFITMLGKPKAPSPQQPPLPGGGGGASPTGRGMSSAPSSAPSGMDTAPLSNVQQGRSFTTAEDPLGEGVLVGIKKGLPPQDETSRVIGESRRKFGGMSMADIKKYQEESIPAAMKQVRGREADLRLDMEQLQQMRGQVEQLGLQAQALGTPEAIAEYEQAVSRYNSDAGFIRKQYDDLQGMARVLDSERQMSLLREYEIKSETGSTFGATLNNMLNNVGSTVSGFNSLLLEPLIAMDPPKPRSGETQEQANARVRKSLREGMREAPVGIIGTKGTTPEYIQKMQEGFLGGAWLGATGTAPTAFLGPGGLGMMMSAADNTAQEMEGEEFANIPEWKKALFSNTIGAIVGQLEKKGFRDAVSGGKLARRILVDAIDKLPANASAQQVRAILNAETGSAVQNMVGRLMGGAASEAKTEAMQGIIEPTAKEAFNAMEAKNLMPTEGEGDTGFETPNGFREYVTDVLTQAAQGAIGGAIFATPTAMSDLMRESKLGKTATDSQFEAIEQMVKDADLEDILHRDIREQVEAAKMSKSKADEAIAAWKQARKIVDAIPPDLTTEKRREAFDLLTLREELSKYSKAMVGEKIAAIDEKLGELAGIPVEEDAAPKKETVSVKEEKTTTPAEGAVTPEVEPLPTIEQPTEVEDAGTGNELEGPSAESVFGRGDNATYLDNAQQEDAGLGAEQPGVQSGMRAGEGGPISDEGRTDIASPPTDQGEATGVPPDTGAVAISSQSLQDAFGYTPEVAEATVAIADAMGLDKSKIKVVKGGKAGENALFQEQVDGWYSRLDQAVSSKGSTMPASQWKAWLEARAKEGMMSMEEAKWTGLSDWLASKGNERVTPQQVRDFLKENRVKVEIIEKGDNEYLYDNLYDVEYSEDDVVGTEQDDDGAALRVVFRDGTSRIVDYIPDAEHAEEKNKRDRAWDEMQRIRSEYDALRGGMSIAEWNEANPDKAAALREEFEKHRSIVSLFENPPVRLAVGEEAAIREAVDKANEARVPVAGGDTKFSGYQLPGASNYREVLVTLPSPSGTRTQSEEKRLGYLIDAGYSVNDAQTGDDIKEEMRKLQSKKPFREGFHSSHFDEPNILVHLRLNDRTGPNGEKVLFIEELQSDWGQKGKKEGFGKHESKDEIAQQLFGKPYLNLSEGYRESVDSHYDNNKSPVPPAPFVTSTDAWVELGLKQAIRMAVNGGYDKIAWTTGEQQNERYDLSKQVGEIAWEWNEDGTYGVSVLGLDRSTVVAENESQTPQQLEELVGKDIAQRIVDDEGTQHNGKQVGNIVGDDLKIQGTGMKGFYDKIVPTVANKVLKKMGGGKVEDVRIKNHPDREVMRERGEDPDLAPFQLKQTGFSITPKMREEVQRGLPLMQSEKGSVEVKDGGEAIIRALKNPDASTGIHELAHVARRFLFDKSIPQEQRKGITDEHIKTAEQWSGAKDGKWTREAEEKFARGFERYLRDGKAPTEALTSVFEKFANWLREIYRSLSSSPIKKSISPEMRKVFDALVQRGAPKEEAATKPVANTKPSYKIEAPEPVAKVTEVRDQKDAKGKVIAIQYSVPGLEEYPLVAYKQDKGWGVTVKGTGADIPMDSQPTARIAIGVASEVINKAGKEKLDKAIDKALAEKESVADKLDKFADDLEKKLRGMAGAFPVPPSLIVGALRTAAKAIRAGESATKAIRAAIEEFKDTKFYKSLSPSDQGKSEREVRENLNVALKPKEPKADKPSEVKKAAERTTGVKPEKKMEVVDEMKALKDQIRLEVRAAREGAKGVAQRIAEVLDRYKGKMTPRQAAALANAAARVKDGKSARKFADYADKVIADSEYATKEAEAKTLRKKIAKHAKGKSVEKRDAMMNELASQFASLNIAHVDIDEYLSIARRLEDALASPKVLVDGDVVTATKVDNSILNADVAQYVDKQLLVEQGVAEAAVREDLEEMRLSMGLDAEALSQEEMDALIAAAMDAEAESKLAKRVSDSEQKVAMLKSMARIKMAELDKSIAEREEALSADQKDIVDGLKKIDIDRLTPIEATWLIGAVNNIILNDRWGGVGDFAAKGIAEDFFREAPGYFDKLKLGRPGEVGPLLKRFRLGNSLFNKTDTVAAMMEKIARGPTAAAWLKEKIGFHGTMNALAEARGRLDAKRSKRANVAKRHGFSDRDNSVQNWFKMGVYAYLIQGDFGTPEEMQRDFDERAENLRSSVRKISDPSAFQEQRDKAKWYERAVEDVLGDAKSVEDLRIAPNLKALVDFEIRFASESEALSAAVAELYHNKLFKPVRNYTAQSQVAVSGERTREEARKDFAAPAWRTKLVDTSPSSSKHERTNTLRPGHIIDLDFFNVVDRSYFETELDNIGSRHIAVMRDAVNDPRMKELLGADTQKLLRDKMLKVLGFEASKEEMLLGKSFAKMYGRVARRSAGIALKGVMQAPKQMTVGVSTAIGLGKDIDLLADSYADAWKAWGDAEGSWQYEMIRDEQIHERAKSLGGLEQIGDTISKKAILEGDEAAFMEAAKIFAHKWYVTTEKLEYPLKFGDAFSAQAAWFAFYKKKLRQKGVDLKSDDWKYEKDKEAAAYANQMVERMQNANTTMAMPDAYHDKGFGKIFLDFFFSFSSFNLNNRKRIARDIDTLKNGANEDKAYAGRDLAAIFVEMVAFNSMAYGLTLGAKGVVDALADKMFGDDDEEDGGLAFWQEVLLRSTWDYLFTGIPEVAQHPLKRGVNKLSDKAVQEITDGAREKVRKDGKDLFYVPNDQGYGVFGAMADEMANFYTGVANRNKVEGQFLVFFSALSLLGGSDQTITRPLERELASRLRERKDAGRRRTPKERMEAKLKYRKDRIKRMKERMERSKDK